MGKDDGGLWDIIGAAAAGIGILVAGAAAVTGIIVLVKISYDAIRKYLNKARQIPGAETAELIKKNLSSGKYHVVCNVFDKKGKHLDKQEWEGKDLDSELKAEFGRKDKIVYDLTA